ncbi:MAG TPA: hypothetical protein VKF82_02495 [Candidatus Eremiobacteraceae bacterium]|nr:hypothetical protein [Candidatus Eremiobacteraceae bacterium]
MARKFRNIYTGVGTPETWLAQYDVTFAEDQVSNSQSYKLKGVPKGTSSVGISYVLLDVASDTFAPTSAHVFYSNGGTVALQFENEAVNGIYRLPALETIDIAFPDYKVHAVAHYGAYEINAPIPESIWQSSPQPLPT